MPAINETSKTCIVQTFKSSGPLDDIIDVIDRDVRDFINEKQQDYWFIQHVQTTIIPDPINYQANGRCGMYIVHLVMSRLYD